jgi:nitrogen fixation protein NifQ
MEHLGSKSFVPDPSGSESCFDRHVLGRMLLHASAEAALFGEPVADRLGLGGADLAGLLGFLELDCIDPEDLERRKEPDDEESMVRSLLVENRTLDGPVGPWLAGILARRSLEPNHLWEDLGLATRPDLTKLLLRHFGAVAEKNTRNMRWKKFLYRALCEAEGFSMCPSPTCDACSEFGICYGDESAQSALARNGRQATAR